ncbi:MAG: hypothetical protein OXH50_08740, partial [Gemmatimonadetes bacterium]|nr:hypothetical protein [Gemmatimonadota bacterium]
MLVEYGAEVVELSLEDRFTAAVKSGDLSRARQLFAEAPAMIEKNPELLLEAATNAAATRLLLDLGADPDAPNE